VIWRYSAKDAWLAGLSLAHAFAIFGSAYVWPDVSIGWKLGIVLMLSLLNTYSIIIVAHLFTHNPWFRSPRLNAAASVLNSVNIGQSMQAYHVSHVRNHHRYHNDRPGPNGPPRDLSSTYADSTDGTHLSIWRYAFGCAFATLRNEAWLRLTAFVPGLAAEQSARSADDVVGARLRQGERRQMRLELIVLSLVLLGLLIVRPSWVLFAYLPSFFTALVLVNVQNYFEHFGARPENRFANSVSHYGRFYNFITFNDGYHQEHHLCPQEHWSRMENVRRQYGEVLADNSHVVSPVPAIFGFLDRRRNRTDRASRDMTPARQRGKSA
jgi:fatty acid desaturase